ncbi:MAG: pro-sigmaK processing inhibitor BofA family protein [Clostridium sp.]|jgi:inhibitor of the pro-sigma K processing machinery|nr:pro-sigmaK processing inhibitor BofA family protein [Clostridium sp.]
MKEIGIIVIVALCLIVLLIGALKKRVEWLLNFIVRGVVGVVAIYFINMGLATFGVTLNIGINAATVLTTAFLGFPGLVALYGLGLYNFL